MRITFSKLAFDLKPILLRPVLGLALVAALAPSCGGGSTTGTPGAAGTSGGAAGTTGSAGTTGTAGTSGTAGTTGAGGNSSGGNAVAGSSGGDAAGSTGSGGSGVAGSTGGATGGSGGGQAGRGGSSAGTGGNATGGTGGGQAGRGGSSAGTGGASAGTGGRGGGGGGTGGGGAPTCPTNNTFCSGFETTTLPAGAIYNVDAAPGDWSRDFAVDTAVKNSGASSLRVKWMSESGASGSAYRMLAVPATMNAFWVRFFIRSDMPIGLNPHNVFAGGSVGSGTNDGIIEFAEDVGISFNTNDSSLTWPTGYGRINGNMMPYSLAASTWHCVEISFDGTARVQQLYVGGTQLINATGHPSGTTAWPLRFFKFGHRALHPEIMRVVWYDDVAVAPTRIGGCN